MTVMLTDFDLYFHISVEGRHLELSSPPLLLMSYPLHAFINEHKTCWVCKPIIVTFLMHSMWWVYIILCSSLTI